jgi:alkanesulfonate monooxygenase SsuD/methylene tetrahydromethanopterin reductase-like flavin-dependent oxidoreductase (luciferase family)
VAGVTERLPIGVTLGTIGLDAATWLEAARRLDDAGYAAIWAWDHFVGQGDPGVPVLEAWTMVAASAATTRRARVGTFVTNVMNRHPAVLARIAGTVQAVSGGRLVLGIGIGGGPREHATYGIEFPAPAERAARLEEAIAVLRALWTGGPVTLDGRFYELDGAHAHPVPVPPPPILVGARTPAGVRLAARAGDGWAAEADVFDDLVGRYEEALAAEGRARGDQHVVVGFGGGRSGEDALRGSPWVTRPAEELARWRARGADEVAIAARTAADVDALVRAADRG